MSMAITEAQKEIKKRKKRIKADGSKFQRKGKILGKLREFSKNGVPLFEEKVEEVVLCSVDIGRLGILSRMGNTVLSLTMSRHLMQVGLDSLKYKSYGCLLNYNNLYERLFTSKNINPQHQEIIGAVIIALGSRWTDHPAIIGSLSSLDSKTGLSPGQARENACFALLDRVSLLVDEFNILNDTSQSGREIFMILQIVSHVVYSRHPFSLRLIGHRESDSTQCWAAWEYDSTDATRTDDNVAARYGWDDTVHDIFMHRLEKQWARAVVEAPHDTTAMHDLYSTFRASRRCILGWSLKKIQAIQSMVSNISVSNKQTHDLLYQRLVTVVHQLSVFERASTTLISKFPSELYLQKTGPNLLHNAFHHESILLDQIITLNMTYPQEVLLELKANCEKRLVKLLSLLVRYFSEAKKMPYTASLALFALDYCPNWAELMVKAAHDYQSRKGEFAELGVKISDIACLRVGLRFASWTFGCSTIQEKRLLKAMRDVGMEEQLLQYPIPSTDEVSVIFKTIVKSVTENGFVEPIPVESVEPSDAKIDDLFMLMVPRDLQAV